MRRRRHRGRRCKYVVIRERPSLEDQWIFLPFTFLAESTMNSITDFRLLWNVSWDFARHIAAISSGA